MRGMLSRAARPILWIGLIGVVTACADQESTEPDTPATEIAEAGAEIRPGTDSAALPVVATTPESEPLELYETETLYEVEQVA